MNINDFNHYKRTTDKLRSRKFFTCSFIRDKSRDTIRTEYVASLPSFAILVEIVDNTRDTFEDRRLAVTGRETYNRIMSLQNTVRWVNIPS